jgi:hypothetical protein
MSIVEKYEYFGTLLALGAIIWLADRRFPILRDIPVNSTLPPVRRPFSLARVQMAVWTTVIIGTIVYIYAVHFGDSAQLPAIDTKLIALLGGSGLTAILAGAVDVNKDKTVEGANSSFRGAAVGVRSLNAQIQSALTLRDSTGNRIPNVSMVTKLFADRSEQLGNMSQFVKAGQRSQRDDNKSGFFSDLLTDQNGNSLHRLQLLLFTALYVGYFVVHGVTVGLEDVLKAAPMSDQVLSLMGVTGGVYVGFKVPGKSAATKSSDKPVVP